MKLKLLFIGLMLIIMQALNAVNAPAWWQVREVTLAPPYASDHPLYDTGNYDAWMQDNYSVALLGQLKHFAKQAYLEMESLETGSAGPAIASMVAGFSDDVEDNYVPLLLGQLKAIAKPFYDRFYLEGYVPGNVELHDPGSYPYPWDDATAKADNYTLVTLGQLKYVFSFTFYNNFLPEYEPGYWNDVAWVRTQNNCYNYAVNNRTDTFAQPGRASDDWPRPNPWDGDDIYQQALSDGLQAGLYDAETDVGYINVALRYAPPKDIYLPDYPYCATHPTMPPYDCPGELAYGIVVPYQRDYHWYRQDRNGYWSHKPGATSARNYDSNEDLITDPSDSIGVSTDSIQAYGSDAQYYTEFIAFMHVVTDPEQGQGTANIE